MGEILQPFELRKFEGVETLWLHGTRDDRRIVETDKIPIIVGAMHKGWSIDIAYADIKGELDMSGVHVRGRVKIENSSFLEDVLLESIFFLDDVSFSEARFCGLVVFDDVCLVKKANFYRVAFESLVFFNNETSFVGGAEFYGASWDRAVQFDNADFRGSMVSFDRASFHGEVTFGEAYLGTSTDFNGVLFSEEPDLSSAIHDELYPVFLDRIGWSYRKSFLFGASYFFEEAGKSYLRQESPAYSEASDSFRNAKIEYEKEGKYSNAGKMYAREKECLRLHLKAQKDSLGERTWLWVWKHTCKYGESPSLFAIRATTIILAFTVVYMPLVSELFDWWPSWLSVTFKEYPFRAWSGGGMGIVKAFIFNFVTALYFSVVTFATLGFGDIAPISVLGKLCAIAEVMLGYVMFGMLITLVVRKVTRS